MAIHQRIFALYIFYTSDIPRNKYYQWHNYRIPSKIDNHILFNLYFSFQKKFLNFPLVSNID